MLHEPELDEREFGEQWLLWQAHVELLRKYEKTVIPVTSVDRGDVVLKVLKSVGWTKKASRALSPHPISPFKTKFKRERVVDEGGASRELLSLFFEQLHDLEITVKDVSFKLFEIAPTGCIYLPAKIPNIPLDDMDMIKGQYFYVGRVFAKAIVEGCPIPSRWASDFLIGFFLCEEPTQESKVSMYHAVKTLVDMDSEYEWLQSKVLAGEIKSLVCDLMAGGLTRVDGENCQKVVRRFVADKVCDIPVLIDSR